MQITFIVRNDSDDTNGRHPYYCLNPAGHTATAIPRTGNDRLRVGGNYLISIYRTQDVFTTTGDGNDIHIKQYTGESNQIWRCTIDPNNRIGFANKGTNKWLGWDGSAGLRCAVGHQLGWECLVFRGLPEGGYQLFVTINNRLSPMYVTGPSRDGELYMATDSSNSYSPVGLHLLN